MKVSPHRPVSLIRIPDWADEKGRRKLRVQRVLDYHALNKANGWPNANEEATKWKMLQKMRCGFCRLCVRNRKNFAKRAPRFFLYPFSKPKTV